MTVTFWQAESEPREELLVSSVRVTFSPRHAHLRVWNRGGYSGELTILRDDWVSFVRLLGFTIESIDKLELDASVDELELDASVDDEGTSDDP